MRINSGMDTVDVTGYALGTAQRILRDRGIGIFSITVTAAPKSEKFTYSLQSRVLRQNLLDNGEMALTVCNL